MPSMLASGEFAIPARTALRGKSMMVRETMRASIGSYQESNDSFERIGTKRTRIDLYRLSSTEFSIESSIESSID